MVDATVGLWQLVGVALIFERDVREFLSHLERLSQSGGPEDCDTIPHSEYHATNLCFGLTLITG